ncbi:ComEC/Rec2 family competence protein [Gordonia hankookensis]|uniref:ComEC/Rec2 family competence protein n=1 Tax=Gordonia hankookensis TaxID=589403 RepID=A0ABR7W700_9ACTN|nr:ComEC/Rec2 family competence protein [Gordonia hankookensis]
MVGLIPSGDYRLVVPASVIWVVSVVGLLGPPDSLWPIVIAGGAGCATCVGAVRRGWVSWSAVSFVVVICGVAAVTAGALAIRLDARAAHPLSHIDGKVGVTVIIRDDPVTLDPGARVRIRVDVAAVAGRDCRRIAAELIGPGDDWAEVTPGQHVSALVRISPARGHDLLAARLSAVSAPRLVGRPPPHQRVAGDIRQRLRLLSARALGPDASGLLPGLVLGDTSMLGAEVRDDFREAGLTHLLAVSGSNFAIVCGAAIFGIRWLGASPWVTAVAGTIVLVGFVILVRPSPSVLRAAMMGMVGLLALVGSRRAQAMPALGGATVIGLLWWPELAVAPGFALSVSATAGLVLWSGGLRDWLRDRRVPPMLAELVAMAAAAQLATAPLIAVLSGRFSIVGLLANILVVPVVGLVGVVGTAAAVVGAIGGPDGVGARCAELVIRGLEPELWWMSMCARVLGRLSWAAVPVPSGVVGGIVVAGGSGLFVFVLHLLAHRAARRGELDARAPGRGRDVGRVWHHGRRDATPAPAARGR